VFQNDKNSDAALLKLVNQKLSRGGGGSQSRITATVQRGSVTLSGKLQYDAQRAPLMKGVASVAGVRRVIDQLTVPPRVNQYAAAEARATAQADADRKAARDAQAAADEVSAVDTELDDAADDETRAAAE
jgi:hypothetical protein